MRDRESTDNGVVYVLLNISLVFAVAKRIDWRGSFPAVVTPFDKQGNLDEAALREMLRLLMEDGASGVVMLGDNGEWWALTDEEKKTIFDISVDVCSGKIPVIGTTTGYHREEKVIELTQYAKDVGMGPSEPEIKALGEPLLSI